MAKIEKEKVITSYSGNLYKRLYKYMKPYLSSFIIALILTLVMTGFNLVRPMMIARVMDTYIQGYDRPYAIVSEEEAEISYNGVYLNKDIDFETDTHEEYALLSYYSGQYYYSDHLTHAEAEALLKANSDTLDIAREETDAIVIRTKDGSLFEARQMSKEDLKVLRKSDVSGILRIGAIYSIILILNTLCMIGSTWLLRKAGQDIIYNIRNEIFAHVHSLPLRFFDTHPVGQIVTRVTNDVESLSQMYSNVIVSLFRNVIMIIGYVVVMLSVNVRMALVCFILFPLVMVLTYTFTKLSRSTYRVIRTKVSGLNTYLSEHISGMKLIQIFNREKFKYKQFTDTTDDLFRSRMRELFIFAIFRPLITFTASVALILVIYFGSNMVLKDLISVGTLYIFTSYIRSFFEPIQSITEQFSTLQNAFASAEKIFTLMDELNTIVEKDPPTILDEVRGKIEFKHVWFAYDDEEYVLKDVSFKIEPGEKVAFVGATGAGKSSILNLIGRYYDIQKGEILIDDVNIKDLSLKQLRGAIGQVQQDVFVFTGDIRSNIKLLNKDITDEEMINASIAVNANHFIDKLPGRYDEPVTERGSTLSAGQRQLLSFARTLVIDPKILVMDEATANIDTETEQLIQEALERMMEGRTTIMVAHRLSTIQHADNIIVMHKGRITEQGNHQQLLQNGGIYSKLYELQLYNSHTFE